MFRGEVDASPAGWQECYENCRQIGVGWDVSFLGHFQISPTIVTTQSHLLPSALFPRRKILLENLICDTPKSSGAILSKDFVGCTPST